MRRSRRVLGWLPRLWLTACVGSQTQTPTVIRAAALTPGPERPALNRLLTRGDIHMAEAHLQAFGFAPRPVDGFFTAQTQAAVRAF